MELKQVIVNNGGMSQDTSISKQDNKFAFENQNIRIQSTDDGTLLSVTNLKDPKATYTFCACNKVIGSCVTPDYLILFCIGIQVQHHDRIPVDIIYRIDLNDVDNTDDACKTLYKKSSLGDGGLGFNSDSYIDTLYYEEGKFVKKVYWTDGIHRPRVINLITPGERVEDESAREFTQYESNVFEFYPNFYESENIEINVSKTRNVTSELPSGVIQYFASYYYVNGAETLIANSSSLYTIDYADRGGRADETGLCAFNIEIPSETVNTNFDYIRIYSARRTSYNGPLTVNIVGDIKIDKDFEGTYSILDNGINQEQLSDSYIYFIGGSPFIAKTLTEKDGTAFFGNITTEKVLVSDLLKEVIRATCFEDEQFSDAVSFGLWKNIPNIPSSFGAKYPYRLQLDKGSRSYKTFKSGEIYRFGIQFQTKQGQWTDVVWIGDAECTERPIYNEDTQEFQVNDATFTMPNEVKRVAGEEGYVNYRIVIADAENSNGRKIKAQGILCPTMFTPGQRAMNAPYSLPSWVMRPIGGDIAYHHFEPIFSSVVEGSEVAGFSPDNISNDNVLYPVPYSKTTQERQQRTGRRAYLVTYLAINTFNTIKVRTVKIYATPTEVRNNFYDAEGNELSSDNYEVLCDYQAPLGGIYNRFDDCRNAVYDGNQNHNPYGLSTFDTQSSKYIYNYQDSSNATVKGWNSTTGIPTEWIMSPSLMGDIAYSLSWSSQTTFEAFINNFVTTDDTYILGSHITDNMDAPNQNLLNSVLRAHYYPIYAFNALHTLLFTGRVPSHTDSEYDQEGFYTGTCENYIFSKVKETYNLATTPLGGKNFCTLPEIFRPRCVVTEFGGDAGTSGSDINLYEIASGVTCPGERAGGLTGNAYQESYIQIIALGEESPDSEISSTYNDYFVDESILTLNSPDIDNVNLGTRVQDLRIVGIAQINNSTSAFDAHIKEFASIAGEINTNAVADHNSEQLYPLYSDFLYTDAAWNSDKSKLETSGLALYKTYLFAANNYLGVSSTGELIDFEDIKTFSGFPGEITKQQIFNQLFSNYTLYFKNLNACNYSNVYCKKIEEGSAYTNITTNQDLSLYEVNFDSLIVNDRTSHIFKDALNELQNKISNGSTRIKFSTTPHIVINLQDNSNMNHKYILPHLPESVDYFRTIADRKEYVWAYSLNGLTDSNVNTIFGDVRGKWGQQDLSDFYKQDYFIKSIWNEPTPKTSQNFFIPVNVNDSQVSILSILNYGTPKDDIDFKETLKDYGFNPQSPENGTYTMSEDGRKLVFGFYAITSRDDKFYLSTYKKYVTSITYANVGTRQEGWSAYTLGDVIENDDATIYQVNSYLLEESIHANRLVHVFWKENFFYKTIADVLVPDPADPSDITNEEYNEYLLENCVEPILYPIQYTSDEIVLQNDETIEPTFPYLFIGEIYSDITDSDLYGGTDDTALRKLTWLPASDVIPISSDVSTMEGDTYYQRWDCLKTYPTSEEDVNQVVDITSFMVETHKNLDARTDSNRAAYNIMSRPSNFNIFNDVYNQKNNIFSYTTNWNDLNSESAPNQIVWSMTKNYLGDVDTWTNTNITSSTRVKYPVTKLVNYNNNVTAITEHSIEIVSFNSKQLVPTADNSFVELQNSSKVDGTTRLQVPYGSYNMSTLITEKGLYFIDDNENSLIRIGGEAGITKVGLNALVDWLHNNIVRGTYTNTNRKPFRLEYDTVHKDIYIINEDKCLVYSETLDAFTSFLTYSGEYWLYNYNGKLYAYRHGVYEVGQGVNVYEMFGTDTYNHNFPVYDAETEAYLNPIMEYSVWYRLNPGPYSDKVFTNGTLMADCGVSGTNTSNPNSTNTGTEPFTSMRMWTEYQDTGVVELQKILDRPSTLKQKFRFWRFNIPRDANSLFKRDRIRNPWAHLKLIGNSTEKMEFHNLTIQYME